MGETSITLYHTTSGRNAHLQSAARAATPRFPCSGAAAFPPVRVLLPRFDNQLVVYLQNQLCGKAGGFQLVVHGVHRNLDDIRRRTLHGVFIAARSPNWRRL